MRKVSVIVPIYNVEQYLGRCVNSVLQQTYSNLEIILVDDGSPDNSPALCDKYAQTYSNVKVIHKANGGLSSARLAGFSAAEGEYIQFIDSDDYIEPTMIEKMVNAILMHDADLSLCSYNTIHGDQSVPFKLPYNDTAVIGHKEIRHRYVIPLFGHDNSSEINIPGFTCVRMYKKDLINEQYFQSERKYFLEDHIFNLLYADNVQSIAVVNEPLYNYCVNSESLSNCYRKDKWRMYQNIILWFEKYIEDRNIAGASKRLECFLISAICSSVDNAVNSGTFKLYKKEIYEILNVGRFRKILKNTHIEFSRESKYITLLLLKLRMFCLLYLIRKYRLSKRL